MRIYFSGGNGLKSTPEALCPERKPHVMLSFYYLESKGTRERLKAYLDRKRNEKKSTAQLQAEQQEIRQRIRQAAKEQRIKREQAKALQKF